MSVAAAVVLIAIKLATGLATNSLALLSEALHSGTDLVAALLTFFAVGVAARPADKGHSYGHGTAEHLAALAEGAILVLLSVFVAFRAIQRLVGNTNAHVDAAWYAIAGITPVIDLKRLRMREAGGRQFADVVIGVPAGAAVGQGHAAADRVEEAVQSALPRSDVVVHVEPEEAPGIRDRAQAAALSVGRVREVHNINVLLLDGGTEVSLHLKLPGELPLEEAHDVAEQVERAIRAAVPSVTAVQTHLEPLTEDEHVQVVEVGDAEAGDVRRIVREEVGHEPRELRFLQTTEGLVAFLTLGLDPGASLADAHTRASEVEARIRNEHPGIADVIVHSEP